MKPTNEKTGEIQPLLQHIIMPDTIKYVYDFYVEKSRSDILTFLFSPELTQKVGLNGEMLIAVARGVKLIPGDIVLYEADA